MPIDVQGGDEKENPRSFQLLPAEMNGRRFLFPILHGAARPPSGLASGHERQEAHFTLSVYRFFQTTQGTFAIY